MAKVYVVTDGSYSDYTIMGIYDDRALAEEFQKYHGYDDIEEFELNAQTRQEDGYLYKLDYSITMRSIRLISRLDNADSRLGLFGRRLVYESDSSAKRPCPLLIGYLMAEDDEHARKVMAERVASVLAGSAHAVAPLTLSDGTVALELYQVIDGKFVSIGLECSSLHEPSEEA